MFIQNKYSRYYYNIINNAQSRQVLGYVEKHHIIPKSLGGTNLSTNLVALTAREHYICHLLLTKFTIGNAYHKMSYALHRITNKKNAVIKSSRIYEIIRKNHARMLSESQAGVSMMERCGIPFSHPISDYQKEQIRKANSARVWSQESKEKMSASQRKRKIDRPESFASGPFTEEHKQNISKARKGTGIVYKFTHPNHGTFTGTIPALCEKYSGTFNKPYHKAELWKLANGLYKSCKGWTSPLTAP